MKSFSLIAIIVVLFNYFICSTYAENENEFYIVGIKRDDNDDNYDKASQRVQNAINELVNDRMNDIYDIIEENKDTFILENGEMDEKLEELEDVKIRKRSNVNGKKVKYRFINVNAPEYNRPFNKRDLESDVEYIPIESRIVAHICPIKNYYAVKAYLSPEIVPEIEKLENIIYVEKSNQASNEDIPVDNKQTTYYNLDDIKKETKWLDVSVQEQDLYEGHNYFSHLSLISQTKYSKKLTGVYDNNYYYPSSAGKGIDIYLIDEGIYITSGGVRYDDYDTYEGTPDERTINCDARIYEGIVYHYPQNTTRCYVYNASGTPDHGNMVSSVAGGKIFGVAKKANIHMIATGYGDIDEIGALFYIKKYGKPHKSIISISRGHYEAYRQSYDDLLNEMIEEGFIFFASAGNRYGYDCCRSKDSEHFKNFSGYEGMITVGAVANTIDTDMNSPLELANYSNTGDCIFIHAPGQVILPPVGYPTEKYKDMEFRVVDGTSCATPLVAGVAATIMSEYPEIQFNSELIKTYLKDYATEGVIEGLPEGTPNRFLNNGKRTVYSPSNIYKGCGEKSGNKICSSGCCTKNSECIEPSKDVNGLCEYKNDVQYHFGAYSIDGEFYPAPVQEEIEYIEPIQLPPINSTLPIDPIDPNDSTIPTNSTLPSDPIDPNDPTLPTNSTLPNDPIDPNDPTIPTNSTLPIDPIDPNDPTIPTNSTLPSDPIDPNDTIIPNNSTLPSDPSLPRDLTLSNNSTSIITPLPVNIRISPVRGKCGPDYGYCQESGYCCSQYGFCGTTNGYCGTGCQPEYGVCK